MPEMNGLELARHVREELSLEPEPVLIMVTAYGNEEVRSEAEQVGIRALLTKPVNQSLLHDAILEAFGRRAAGPSRSRGDEDVARWRQSLSGMRVLLAEDNAINQQVATELLEATGVSVEIANDGREAVDMVRAAPDRFDAVLMDMQMPEMDGLEATHVIRNQLGLAELPIIAMTAHAMAEERERCLAAGMQEHVTKPIEPEKLYQALASWARPPSEAGHEAAAETLRETVSTTPDGAAVPDELPGIDVPVGLRRVGGNAKLYLKLLRESRAEFAAAGDDLRRLLESDGGTEAVRLAHTVKGVAGNLAAVRLQAAAATLEAALKSGDRAAVGTLIDALEAAAAEVVGGLERLDSPAPARVETADETIVKRAEVAPLVRELAALLREDNLAAEACFDRLAESLGPFRAGEVERMRGAIDDLEFDVALDALRDVAEALEIDLEA
jgi:two-component system sensor histidine kinase/response regulator